MKWVHFASICFSLAAGGVVASEPTDMAGAQTPAGRVVAQYLALTWGPHKDAAAAKKLESPQLVDHGYLGMSSPGTPPPAAPPAAGANPEANATITPIKIVAEGDLVFVQGHGVRGGKGNGDLMWLLYRVKDGKIVEHWDTHNEIPDSQVGKQW